MSKALKTYVIAGCILQFIVFHILQTVAHQTALWFAQHDITQVSTITTASLHMHPLLNVFTFAIWAFVIYAFFRKKSELVFAHILGVLLVSSLGAVVFQAFGIMIVFAGTLIGRIE
jgi:hypothetical protein